MTAQLRSAGVSVPSNIAEGQGRASAGEWVHFLGHARGSLNEVQTEIEIAKRLGYVSPEYASALSDQSQKIGSGLSRLIDYCEVAEAFIVSGVDVAFGWVIESRH